MLFGDEENKEFVAWTVRCTLFTRFSSLWLSSISYCKENFDWKSFGSNEEMIAGVDLNFAVLLD